jgi:hypothetical protein
VTACHPKCLAPDSRVDYRLGMWRVWPIFGWGRYRVSFLRIVKSAAACVIDVKVSVASMEL